MNHVIGCKDNHCCFCFRKTDVEYIDFHNDDGYIVFAIHVCKNCIQNFHYKSYNFMYKNNEAFKLKEIENGQKN